MTDFDKNVTRSDAGSLDGDSPGLAGPNDEGRPEPDRGNRRQKAEVAPVPEYPGAVHAENVNTSWVDEVWQIRQTTMDRHYAEHPEPYVNGAPMVKRPPQWVAINPDDGKPAEAVLADPESFATVPTPVSVELPEVVT